MEIQYSQIIAAYLNQFIILPISYQDTVGYTFEWMPTQGLSCTNCAIPVFNFDHSQNYTLTVTNNLGCSETISIFVNVNDNSDIYVPNVFSPNGDLKNDRFVVFGNDNIEKILHLRIYSRWGGLIYERLNFPVNSSEYGWDGTLNGKVLNPGIFIYTLEAVAKSGQRLNLGGDVLLLR